MTALVAASAGCAASSGEAAEPTVVGAKGDYGYVKENPDWLSSEDGPKNFLDLDELRENAPDKVFESFPDAFRGDFCYLRKYAELHTEPLAIVIKPTADLWIRDARECEGCVRRVAVHSNDGSRVSVDALSKGIRWQLYGMQDANVVDDGSSSPTYTVVVGQVGLVIRATDDATEVTVQIGDACGEILPELIRP